VGNLILRYSPTHIQEQAVLVQKGHRMTTEELRALKNKLQQLDVELKETVSSIRTRPILRRRRADLAILRKEPTT
jgi:uncharacterized protein with von Willebrand factor type A (vWA) domain